MLQKAGTLFVVTVLLLGPGESSTRLSDYYSDNIGIPSRRRGAVRQLQRGLGFPLWGQCHWLLLRARC